jgi:hypothetical protein
MSTFLSVWGFSGRNRLNRCLVKGVSIPACLSILDGEVGHVANGVVITTGHDKAVFVIMAEAPPLDEHFPDNGLRQYSTADYGKSD